MKKYYYTLLMLFVFFSISCAGQEQSTKNISADEKPPFAAPSPKFSTPVTMEEIRSAFYTYSVVSIVNALNENDAANWNMIMKKVAEGDAGWIDHAAWFIKPGADAGGSEEFTDALAYALQYNPAAVLSLEVSPKISMITICSLPFIEPSYEFIKQYGEKTLAALHGVDQPHLRESRDLCIQRLQKSLLNCEKLYERRTGIK